MIIDDATLHQFDDHRYNFYLGRIDKASMMHNIDDAKNKNKKFRMKI